MESGGKASVRHVCAVLKKSFTVCQLLVQQVIRYGGIQRSPKEAGEIFTAVEKVRRDLLHTAERGVIFVDIILDLSDRLGQMLGRIGRDHLAVKQEQKPQQQAAGRQDGRGRRSPSPPEFP